MFKKLLPIIAITSTLLIPTVQADNNMDLNQYVVSVINSKLDGAKYNLKLVDNKPVLNFPIPGKDLGGCTVNHKLKDSSYVDFRIRTPQSMNLSLDTLYRKPYLAKRFTIPVELNGKLNMVTRTGQRILGSCSNYSKDNWYYSMQLNNSLIVDLAMILNPRIVNTSHGKAISITPMVNLSAHIKDFNEHNVNIKAHGQNFGFLWGILDFTNALIKTGISNPTHLSSELKKNFDVGAGISIASTLESSGLVTYNQLLRIFDGLDTINDEVRSSNDKFGRQVQELEDNINEKIQIALRKYRPWAAESGEPNPNTVYIPYTSALDNVPEPEPLQATAQLVDIGCTSNGHRVSFEFAAIDSTTISIYRKSGSNWYKTYSGSSYYKNFNDSSYKQYKVEGCNATGCGPATEFNVAGRQCNGQHSDI